MAVRRNLHRVIGGRRGFGGLFGGKGRVKEEDGERVEVETEVLRPVRNRRWQF